MTQHKEHAERLGRALRDSHRQALRLDEPGCPVAMLERLQSWQRERLAVTYADLLAEERFEPAGYFFLAELYGGLHFRERDQQVAQVLPVMVRMLPDHLLLALSEAFELQAMSLDLDLCMAHALAAEASEDLDAALYAACYRACDRHEERARQIELIHRLGLQLNEVVRHRMVLWMVRVMRGPARAAGFGELQAFLDGGLQAFTHMGDGRSFIETIYQRERTVMERLFAADPDPFRL